MKVRNIQDECLLSYMLMDRIKWPSNITCSTYISILNFTLLNQPTKIYNLEFRSLEKK